MAETAELIDSHCADYMLGLDEVDQTHREFIALLNSMLDTDKQQFVTAFSRLVEHTRDHFANEKQLMQKSGFPAMAEHHAEHQRVLGELERFLQKALQGNIAFARAYMQQQLPGWFELHLATMDSALVAHLQQFKLKEAII